VVRRRPALPLDSSLRIRLLALALRLWSLALRRPPLAPESLLQIRPPGRRLLSPALPLPLALLLRLLLGALPDATA
jgi:hypothetical protein